MKILRIILMTIYALNAIGLVGAVFLADPANGGASVIGKLLVVALSVIAILALASKGGKPMRSGAFAFAGLILFLGVGGTIVWTWLLSTGDVDSAFELAAAIAFAIIGWSTIVILRKQSLSGDTLQSSTSENS
jgi:hypothetical protein